MTQLSQSSIPILTPDDWKDYELIDSGEGGKLERFGGYTIARPDPRAIWQMSAPKEIWDQADALYLRPDKESGVWQQRTPPPNPWLVRYQNLVFTLRPTSFKHVGMFPEQAVNWRWITDLVGNAQPNILNLFAYTGGATLAAAAAGATVTHLDSAKSTVAWAKENAAASKLSAAPIRWIVDDAIKFTQREQRRGVKYDAIIMDPPRFGRGSQGEVWKLEEDLPKLLNICKALLSSKPLFILINAYTADMSAVVVERLLSDLTQNLRGTVSLAELALRETASGRVLPSGICARWEARI